MSAFYEMPTTEIFRFLEKPFSSHAMQFLIGVLVLDTLLMYGMFWDKTFAECRDTSNICYKSLRVFHNISHNILYVFGLFFLYYLVHTGAKAHGLKPAAFALVVSFTVFVNLVQWLFRDVFSVMDTSSITEDDTFVDILQKQFYIFTNFFNYTDASTIIATTIVVFAAFISK